MYSVNTVTAAESASLNVQRRRNYLNFDGNKGIYGYVNLPRSVNLG